MNSCIMPSQPVDFLRQLIFSGATLWSKKNIANQLSFSRVNNNHIHQANYLFLAHTSHRVGKLGCEFMNIDDFLKQLIFLEPPVVKEKNG